MDLLFEDYVVFGIGVEVEDAEPESAIVRFGEPRGHGEVSYYLRKQDDVLGPEGVLARCLWCISLPEPAPLRTAYHLAHALEALSPIVPFCTGRAIDEFIAISPLPARIAKDPAQRISAELLESTLGDNLVYEMFAYSEALHGQYRTCLIESAERAEEIHPLASKYAHNDDFARACSYLHLSMTELGVDACDWREQDFDQAFYRYVSVSRAESAFLNAFKVVESVVGEPSKNRTRTKLNAKLANAGIDPTLSIGFRSSQSIVDWILTFHPLRDRIAAHGIGRIKRDLLLSEILELQILARHLLLSSATTP